MATRTLEQRLAAALPRLHRFAWSLSADRTDADDITQAAIERALTHRSQLGSEIHLEGWLMRVARNLWLDQLRRQKVRAGAVDPGLIGRFHALAAYSDPATRYEASGALAAFDDLPPGQKEVAALVLIEGFTYQDAAEALEIPMGTVMSRLARARVALAQRILGPEPEPLKVEG